MNLVTLERKYALGVSSFLLVSLAPLSAQALTVEEVPNPQQDGSWVTDMAEILNDKTEDKLNMLISQLEAENGAEIAVVTVPQTSPSATTKEFTTELFNHWGIGKADEDNGILFLVSTGDRRVEIETGYGIEPILPDAKVGNIIDTKITPQFKQGNYDDGALAGSQALVNALQNQTSTTSSKETNSTQISQSDSFGSLPFFGLIAILAVVTGLLFKSKRRHRSTESKSSTSSVVNNSNIGGSGSNSNSDRSAKDKSSTNQTIASSRMSDLSDWHSKNKPSSGSSSSDSSKKSRRRSSRHSSGGSSSSSYAGGGSSSGSSSSGGSFGGGSSGGGGAGGSF